MAMEKKTIKIIVIVTVVVLILGTTLGLLLAFLLPYRYVELEVWPRSDEYNWDQPVIQFKPSDAGNWNKWYTRLNDFLRVYETSVPEDPARAPCSVHNAREPQYRSDACVIAMRLWAPCTADHFYGYDMGRPCIFLRLNNIHYWVPQPFNATSSLPIPNEIPSKVKQFMMDRPAHQYGDYVWVSCKGEFSADEENIGPIQYIPAGFPPGFPTARLHTADRIAYSSRALPETVPGPLVGVFFENPRRGVLINVECRVWTRDIYDYGSSRIGRARFELFIE